MAVVFTGSERNARGRMTNAAKKAQATRAANREAAAKEARREARQAKRNAGR